MRRIFIPYLILSLIIPYFGIKAQCTFTTTVSDVTLQCTGGTSNRSGIAYNPNQYLYYSVNAGSGSYLIETFANTGGSALSTVTQSQDYRGYWWNSVTGKPEGNTFNGGGIYSNSLNGSAYATSTTSFMTSGTMPSSQQCGQADIPNNLILYYDAGYIYKYNRTSGLLTASVSVTGLPASIANLNSTSLIFTGIAGKEVGLYDYVNSIVYFVNYTSGVYVSSCNLPATAPAASYVQMGYGNNRIFLYNTTINAWIGYPIVNPSCAGEALNFDGVNDYVTISNLTPWNMGSNFTYETWIKPNSLGNQLIAYAGYGCIVCPDWVLSIGPELTCFGQGTAGRVMFFAMGVNVQSDVSPEIGAWTHVAVTYNSSVLKMYINGVLQTSSVTLYGGSVSGTSYMNLGADPGCGIRYKYDGALDEMRIWNKALCQSEIIAGMNCEIATTASGLTLNYHFNQGTAHGLNTGITSLSDVSGSVSNGSLSNFALNGYASNWVAGSLVRSGNTCPAITNPNISVTGNSQQVHGGNPNPIPANNTDFGNVNTGSSVSHTFVILNTGNAALNISAVTISGPDASSYSVTTSPAAVVASSGSTALVITFSPSSIGLLSATVNIASNDCDENPYSFDIEGSGTIPAAALSFDGINDYIDLGSTNVLKPTTALTVESWLYHPTWTGTFTPIGCAQFAGFKFRSNGLTLNADVYRNGGFGVVAKPLASISPGWHHVALTYDSRYMKFYFDGILVGINDAGGNYPITYIGNSTLIGAEVGVANLPTPAGDYFDGSIDELRYWNVVRTQCEIQSFMNCEIPTTAVGLVGNFHFNQGFAAVNNATLVNLTDASASAISGTLINMALTGTVSNWVAPGSVNSGFSTSAPPSATISLSGNANPILNNATSTTTLNFTDFGSATSRTFVIQNTGTGTLNVGTPFLSGLNAAEFSITVNPSATLSALASTSFVVAFTPTTGGARNATININNNDCAKPNFNFAIQGTAPIGEALSLSGSIDLVAGPVLSTNTTNLTLQAKVYWRGTNGQGQMIVYNGNSSSSGYGIYNTIGSGALSVLYGGISFTPFNYTLTPNQWTSLTLVIKNGLAESYVNGLLTNVANVAAPATPSGSFNIGGNILNAENFNGVIDEVLFWDKALTQCEIQTYLNCEIPGAATNLVGNYHFNQGAAGLSNSTVTTVTDASGNSINLNLISVALTGTVSNWVAPGAVVSGYTITSPPAGTISLTGNGNPILNNATITSTLNFTDFGTSTSRTFVIQNTGAGTLNIGVPYLSGLNAGTFSFSTLPSSTLAALASTSFVVVFTPTTGGTYTATININNNDCAKPIFNFAIQATPLPGAALSFDGIDDRVTSIDINPSTLPVMTFEAWVYRTATNPGVQTIIGNDDGGYDRSLNLTGDTVHIWAGRDINTKFVSALNTWEHYMVTWSATEVKCIKNGTQVYSTSGQSASSSALQAGIGSLVAAWTFPFQGLLDEVRIWNTTRTQCQVQTFMNCEIPGSSPGLLVNYHFNQGAAALDNTTVTAVTDASGSSNTGTIVNMSLLTGTVGNWVSPGAVVSGNTVSTVPTASLAVTGAGNPIAAGSTISSLTNLTSFGTVFSRSFVLQNTGTGPLSINSLISLSGANAAEFTVTSVPSVSIGTAATSSLIIAFTPTSVGTKSAIVNINSSDCANPNYSFVITATAVVGSAINCDGVNDYMGTPVFNTLTSNVTLQARFLWNGIVTNNKIIAYNGNSSNNGYGLFMSANTNSLFAIYGGINVYNTGYTVSPGVWTAAAMVIEPGRLSVYVNGVLTNTFLAAGPGVPTTSFNIGTGTVTSLETFNGSIDEVQLWSRALTQCEIASYLNCEVSGSPSGLIANYHFNQGIASGANSTTTVLTDASGNNNNLSLYNFSLTGTSSNWISSGAVTSGSSCPAFVAPEIDVQSNAISVVDGDVTPSTTDNTDFGNISTNAGVSKTFTILNTGSAPLTVSSITMGGLNANQFTLSALSPASPVGIGSSATFTLTFAPTSIGTKTAIVTITNNDCDEGVYDFVVSGSSTVGAAFSFDGTNDYVNVGPILTASYTKECWVKIQLSSNGNNFLSSGAGINGSALWAPGLYNYSLSAGHDGNWAVVQDNTPLLFGTWYHVAVSYDAASQVMSLYKNGILVSTNTVAPFTGNNPLSIGAFSGNFTTNGSMDEVRIWNRALCPSEILNNLNCEIATTAPGLIANYHFNQGIGYGANATTSLVTDASGSSNTGTLVGVALSGTVSNWQSQGAVVSGSACSSIFVPEINLVGNAITINDGDMTPSATDNTDYGAVCVNGTIVKTYTIQNTGTANLTVSGISFTGVNAALFTASALSPASPIPAGSQAVFSVSFAPLTSGVKNTTLTITNNDCNENPYDVALSGTCNPLPVVTTTASNPVICVGFSTSVSGIGADTYTWTSPIINGQAFTPTISSNYTVVGTNTLTGCTSTNLAVQSITVNQSPTLTASASTLTICNGKTSTLTASGANTFTWNPGIVTNSSSVVGPSTNTTYSVSGTSTAGCLSSNTIALTLTVNALPTVTASSSNSFVCDGFTTSLIGSGANTYTWTSGILNNTAFVPPSSGATYSLSGTFTLTGCTSTNAASQSIVVNPIPTLAVASDSVICYGDSYSISVSGAATYTWLPGTLSGSLVVVSPTSTTSYSVVGTSTAACTSTNSAIQTISVNPLPSLSITPSSTLICSGSSVNLSGAGANTYTWTNGISNATAFSSTITSTYSLSGTSLAGCTSSNSAFITVSVNPLPLITASSSKPVICIGDQSSLIAAGALSYTWSGGVTNTVVFNPTVTTTYTVVGTDANTCTNAAVASITVHNLPDLIISSTNSASCEGETNTITVSGASTYTWSGGQNVTSIYINPIITTSYSVNAIDTNGCFNSTVYTQMVSLCDITIYNGITANNDGINDVMRIEKIEQFKENKVSIYNRWGKQVAEITGYNNKDKAWPLAEDLDKLPPSTYFYIIDLGNGGKPFKGWVELIKN